MVFDSYRTLVDYFHFMLVQNSTQFMHSFEASQKKRQESQERENFQRENNSSSSASY